MADPNNCAICDWSKSEVRMQQRNQGLLVTCPRCGEYVLADNSAIYMSSGWGPEVRNGLSCASRQAFEVGQRLQITESNAADLAQPHMNTRVVDNQERLLREIARRAVRPQNHVTFSPRQDFTIIDCYSEQEFRWYVAWLDRERFVYKGRDTTEIIQLHLSSEGWRRVQPAPRPGGFPGTCFVAMWFSEETQAAYSHGIERAISDAGFKPVRIDRKEHNNEIPDEIIAEIRNSEFVVADFTGQRSGVYYEAGFAMGLGRRVIWCCRKDEIDKLHFDTNHKNHIDWETPNELHDRLYKRIRATILEQG